MHALTHVRRPTPWTARFPFAVIVQTRRGRSPFALGAKTRRTIQPHRTSNSRTAASNPMTAASPRWLFVARWRSLIQEMQVA